MAKKIIIDFSAQPVTDTTGFSFSITVNGFDLYFSNGETECNIQYIPFGDTPANFNELAIGTDLENTIQITLDYLRNEFANSLLYYNIVNNTIEVLINADATVLIGETINDSITVTTQDVEPSGINLIYYIIFDDYVLNIYKENYNGGATEIFGTIEITKSTVDNILDPIRGTGLQLGLLANQSITFDEFAISDEFTYKAELLKNNFIIYEGYIKPDGTQQSFVNNEWLINIEVTDGLGALKDLSFVQSNGTQFTGKMSFLEVIEACLNRTRLTLDINTSINLEYSGYTGTNILKDVYVNSSRFIKESNDIIIMDCNEVLTSILNLMSAVITQQDGQWWVYRPNDLQATGYTEFINQTTEQVFNVNLNKSLGSQINNFYPHHCGANQQIEVKGAISAYRLNYEYGFLDGYFTNSSLNHDDDLNFDEWTVIESAGIIINDPNDLSGLMMNPSDGYPDFPAAQLPLTEVLESDPAPSFAGVRLTFRTKVSVTVNGGYFYFKIKTSDGYFLNTRNQWEVGEDSNTYFRVRCKRNNNVTFELLLPELINDCDVSIIICQPQAKLTLLVPPLPPISQPGGIFEISYIQLLDNTLASQGIVGENHTVSRSLPPSSITKENQKVFNGDGDILLIGSIYKDDLINVTDLWNRRGKSENLPLLGISAMDDLRIQSRPIQVFSGDIYGHLPYLSVVSIDNIVGIFMFTQWSYNLNTNQMTSCKLTQFYNDDLADISYEITPDYGNTIKPTIRG